MRRCRGAALAARIASTADSTMGARSPACSDVPPKAAAVAWTAIRPTCSMVSVPADEPDSSRSVMRRTISRSVSALPQRTPLSHARRSTVRRRCRFRMRCAAVVSDVAVAPASAGSTTPRPPAPHRCRRPPMPKRSQVTASHQHPRSAARRLSRCRRPRSRRYPACRRPWWCCLHQRHRRHPPTAGRRRRPCPGPPDYPYRRPRRHPRRRV